MKFMRCELFLDYIDVTYMCYCVVYNRAIALCLLHEFSFHKLAKDKFISK
jgi:hypothetical protein